MYKTVMLVCNTEEKRNIRKIPITTSVEECISADAGVGASIASGNQTNNKNCAHLQDAATKIEKIITVDDVTSKR